MLSATLAVLALTGLIGPSKTSDVQWHKDYSSAMKLAIEQHKPLAVFITKGYTDSLKKISSDSAKILRSDYVVVVIDSEDADGKKLASIFELNVGVVVSDRTGEKQALRVEGTLTPDDFTRTLERLAKPDHVTSTTEIQGIQTPKTATVCRT